MPRRRSRTSSPRKSKGWRGGPTYPTAATCSTWPATTTCTRRVRRRSSDLNATQTIKDVIAEKIEGMAWGPDLPDGRHVLYVASDNDLYTARPTQIFRSECHADDQGRHRRENRRDGVGARPTRRPPRALRGQRQRPVHGASDADLQI